MAKMFVSCCMVKAYSQAVLRAPDKNSSGAASASRAISGSALLFLRGFYTDPSPRFYPELFSPSKAHEAKSSFKT